MVGALLVLVFLVMAYAMYSGKMPALIALPLLALFLTVVAGVPHHMAAGAGFPGALGTTLDEALRVVVGEGVPRLGKYVFVIMLGGIFGQMVKLTGVAEGLVRRVAELAGDRTFPLCVILSLAVSFLFTTLGGLGAVIMVAGIVFPVMLSLGLSPLFVACHFLMSFSLGGVFNLANWGFYLEALGMTTTEVLRFAAPFGVAYAVVLLVFLVVELKRARQAVDAASVAKVVAGLALGVGAFAWLKTGGLLGETFWLWTGQAFLALFALLFLRGPGEKGAGVGALLAPALPIGAVILLGWGILPAFGIGILYLARTGTREGRIRLVSRAILEGIEGVVPAIALIMGIGMLIVAVWRDPVKLAMAPLLTAVLPTSSVGYVVVFTALAPLALYRGPLNVWGMGIGLGKLVQATGVLSNPLIMAAFLSTGQIQGVCDPTNTHNVWVANQLRVDLIDILKTTLPYIWAVAFLGLVLGVALG